MATAFETLKQKSLQGPSSNSLVSSPISTVAPTMATGSAFEKLKTKAVARPAAPEVPKGSTGAGDFLKGLVSAPLTLAARPIQAAAGLAQVAVGGTENYDPEAIDKFSSKISGGLIAPTPKNASDNLKDVGRGLQTVALGTGAAMTSGALFGLGASVENQGSNIFSAQGAEDAAISTGVGILGGKLLDFVGKPVINKVTGAVTTLTPLGLKNLTAKGTDAVSDFMANHEIVPAMTNVPVLNKVKPAINAIPKVAEKVDAGVNSLFKGTGNAVKGAVQSQYPGISKQTLLNREQQINKDLVLQPVKETSASYNKATKIYNNAKDRGIDLEEIIPETNTFHHQITDKNKFSTLDKADAIEDETMQFGNTVVRQALKEAEPGVTRVSIDNIRDRMISRIDSIPPSQITPEERMIMKQQVREKYSGNSAASETYKDGYSLTDLHDNRIISQKRGKYREGGEYSETLNAERNRYEGQVFNDILDEIAPLDMGLKNVRKEMEKRFILSDYLRALNNKSVPIGIVGKTARLGGRILGATLGAKTGGGTGAILGSRFGDVLFDWLETVPSPVRTRVLNSIKQESPQAYNQMIKYIKDTGIEREARKALPAPRNRPIIVPNTQGTPNQLGRYYRPGEGGGDVGGLRQRLPPR